MNLLLAFLASINFKSIKCCPGSDVQVSASKPAHDREVEEMDASSHATRTQVKLAARMFMNHDLTKQRRILFYSILPLYLSNMLLHMRYHKYKYFNVLYGVNNARDQ